MSKSIGSTAIKLNSVRSYIKANVSLQLAQKAAPRLYMVGAPGCGKSDIVREICQENGWGLIVRYISNMSIEQMTGLPVKPTEGQVATWSVPELFNFNNIEYRPEGYVEGETPTVLLLDDFHLCDRTMQKYMFQLLTYMGLNGYHLPKNTAILLAGNRNNDKAGAMPIPAPVCNRIMFVEVTSDSEDWLQNFALKNDIRGDVCTFIHDKGDVYLSSEPIETNAWASPRSWTYLAYQMDAYEKMNSNIDLDELRVMACGLLGPEITNQFIMYRELFARWNFDHMVKEPWDQVKARYSKEAEKNPTAVYAIINAGVTWLIKKYKDCKYDTQSPELKKAVKMVYNTLAYLLVLRCNKVNCAPLVAAGTKYIHLYQQAQKTGQNAVALIEMIMAEMQQERIVDWIFYELLTEIFNIQLTPEDQKGIENAKKQLAAGKIDI